MTRFLRKIISAAAILFAVNTFAQQPSASTGLGDLEKRLYGELAAIKYFGNINVVVEGTDVLKPNSKNAIGLSSEDLTQYLRLRYRNNFADVPYREIDYSKFPPASERPNIGNLWCKAWTVGDNYPVAYYVECKMGTLMKFDVGHDAALGYGNASTTKDEIRKSIDRMVTEFAQLFFRVRGEL